MVSSRTCHNSCGAAPFTVCPPHQGPQGAFSPFPLPQMPMTIRAKRGNPPRGGATPPRSTGNPPSTLQWATPPRFTSGGNPPCVRSHASTLQKPRFTPQESYLLVLGATPPRFRSLAPRLRSHTSSLPEPSLHVTLDWGQQTHTPPDLQISLACPPPLKLPPHLEIHLYGCSGSEHIWQRDKEEESIDAYQVPMRRGTSPGMVHGCL